MTCIVGLIHNDAIYLGSESLTGIDSRIIPTTHSKVFSRNNILFGICGDTRYNDIIKYRLDIPYHREDKTNMEYLCTDFVNNLRQTLEEAKYSNEENMVSSVPYQSTLILGYKNKLYCIFYDYAVLEFNDFYAIRSGSDYALGSLETTKNLNISPKDRIELALRAACRFDKGCGEPFNIIEKEIS